MDLSDLLIFRAVHQAGGITRAAEKLNRVQSNITTRVQQLEQDLGVELFIRNGKKLHLSPAGAILLDYADRLLDLADEAREAVHDTKPRGMLRLGSMESTAAIRLPEPLIEFHQRYPDVKLELRTGVPLDLSTAVLTGELDAALVAEPIADAPFEKLPLFDEELVLVAPPGHRRIVSPADLNPQVVLAFEANCPYRKRLEQWFAQAGEMPTRIIEMSSYHTMLGCAVAGMGIALLPRMVIDSTPQAKFLSVHHLPANLGRIPTALIWRKGTLSPKVRALKEILEKAGNKARTPTRKKAA